MLVRSFVGDREACAGVSCSTTDPSLDGPPDESATDGALEGGAGFGFGAAGLGALNCALAAIAASAFS